MTRRSVPYWLILPAVVFFVIQVIVPAGGSLFFSVYDWNGLNFSQARFSGFENYSELLRDRVFYRSLFNNILLAAASVIIQIPIALLFALAFYKASRSSDICRAVIFSPMILPSTVIAAVFLLVYDINGPLVFLLEKSIGHAPDFLGSRLWVMPSLISVISWRYIGFHMMLIIAALQTLDDSQIDAARIDGAGGWSLFRHIMLPHLMPTLVLSSLLAVLGSLKYFDLVQIMTEGNPAHASELLTTYLYEMNGAFRFGYANTIGVALLVVSLIAGCVIVRLRREVHESSR